MDKIEKGDITKKRKGLSIACLILAFISILLLPLGILTSIISIILGIISLVKINKNPEKYGGLAMAIIGIVISANYIIFAGRIVLNAIASRM